MNNNVLDYTAQFLNRGSTGPYTADYLGSVRMLEDSGFSPFSTSSPLKSTLTQVFSKFVEKTGIGTDDSSLKSEFLDEYPATQNAMDLYQSLENTFTYKRPGEQAAIVDFLNSKIDEYVSQKDKNSDNMLTLQESGLNSTLFEEIDANNDSSVNADEFKSNFYDNYQQVNNVVNYFLSNPGVLVDMYG